MTNSEQPINPISNEDNYENTTYLRGLTKREYFAGLAMQGMLANGYGDFKTEFNDYIAKLAIEQADELLKQLENHDK